jgi:Na+-translocating ferredoxin:NAD+ oxidoreductase RnfD subunit
MNESSTKCSITVKVHLEVSIPNIMQAAIVGTIIAICCFGMSYGAHSVFPVKPIQDGDVLLSQSTLGTVNFLNKDSISDLAKTPKDMIDLYLARKANLEDILELITETKTIKQAVDTLKTREQTPETKFLLKAIKDNYPSTLSPVPVPAPSPKPSLSIQ